ncbi:cutinase-domain-containing protein [Coniella lustricola]|uniref:Cutinase-domain-containing protein n=1 Tax=Coniella lustricola TaxID=2025994 RepID=A0A2T3ANF0_9PEZI|nr:cutinase-domain-containing protein [Coniella lustricola]
MRPSTHLLLATSTTLLVSSSYAFVIPQDEVDVLAALAVNESQALPDCSTITSCVPSQGAAHIIVSRASTEPAGTGVLGAVADAVVAACPGSDIVANPYPALLSPYLPSEPYGVGNLTELVTTYQACCPHSKIVLMGYSQGAQVTADFLCGTSEVGFPATPAYAASVKDSLAAAVIMGDPTFVKGLPWDRGNASNVSYFPRQDNGACKPVAPVFISYCDSGDLYCDDGTAADALSIHTGYVTKYGAQAGNYTVDKIGGCPGA